MLARIWDRVVFRDPRFYAAFPSAATLADGTVLIAFRRARDHRWLRGPSPETRDPEFDPADFNTVDHLDCRSHHALVRLSPGLEPLDGPEILTPDPEAADQDASLLVLRDGRVMLSGFCWYPVSAGHVPALRRMGVGLAGSPERTGCHFIFWGGFTRLSDDDGRTWTPHRWLPEVPDQGDLVPGVRPYYGGPVRGRAVEAADGTLHLAAYAIRPGTGHHVALLHASNDRGESWEHRGVIAHDPTGGAAFVEPCLQATEDGRLIAFHRTGGLKDRLATSVSRDGGATWEPWSVHRVKGHPYDVCPLPDGRLLVVYGYRHKPYGVRARVWDPYRQSLDRTKEFVIRDDAPSPDVGYPWATVTADGRVLVVYYICDAAGVRHVAMSLLEVRG